jgi:hypothetical protein
VQKTQRKTSFAMMGPISVVVAEDCFLVRDSVCRALFHRSGAVSRCPDESKNQRRSD